MIGFSLESAIVKEHGSTVVPGDWQPYDPTWLVDLATAQHASEPWLSTALQQCRRARHESRAYIHFVDPSSPAWRFQRNLTLASRDHGTLVLDVIEGGAIGGLEFLKRL